MSTTYVDGREIIYSSISLAKRDGGAIRIAVNHEDDTGIFTFSFQKNDGNELNVKAERMNTNEIMMEFGIPDRLVHVYGQMLPIGELANKKIFFSVGLIKPATADAVLVHVSFALGE